TVERVADTARGAGALRREPTSDDLDRLSRSVPADRAAELAAGPSLEVVTWLAQETARRLVQDGFADSAGEVPRDRPGPPARGAGALHSTLGGTTRTYFTRLHAAVQASYRDGWREQVERVNGELTARASAVFTRLALEEVILRTTATDPDIEAAVKERRWARSQ